MVLATTPHEHPGHAPVLSTEGSLVHEDRRVIAGSDPSIELWLEPGGVAFLLPASRHLEVVCRGERHGTVEVERLPDGHTALYAWPGAVFTVLEAGRAIYVEERALSLRTMRGQSTRQSIEALQERFARRRLEPGTRWL